MERWNKFTLTRFRGSFPDVQPCCHDPTCSFLASRFQIAIETCVLFYQSFDDYVCFTVMIHLYGIEPFSGQTYVCSLEQYEN